MGGTGFWVHRLLLPLLLSLPPVLLVGEGFVPGKAMLPATLANTRPRPVLCKPQWWHITSGVRGLQHSILSQGLAAEGAGKAQHSLTYHMDGPVCAFSLYLCKKVFFFIIKKSSLLFSFSFYGGANLRQCFPLSPQTLRSISQRVCWEAVSGSALSFPPA